MNSKATSDIAKLVNNHKLNADFTSIETIGKESVRRRSVIKESLLT